MTDPMSSAHDGEHPLGAYQEAMGLRFFISLFWIGAFVALAVYLVLSFIG